VCWPAGTEYLHFALLEVWVKGNFFLAGSVMVVCRE